MNHIEDIFIYWCEAMKKKSSTKLNDARRRAINRRLDEGYTTGEIKKAIDGCSRSAFHMGQNESGKLYNDIELICRTGVKLESFMDTPLAPPPSTPTASQQNNSFIKRHSDTSWAYDL